MCIAINFVSSCRKFWRWAHQCTGYLDQAYRSVNWHSRISYAVGPVAIITPSPLNCTLHRTIPRCKFGSKLSRSVLIWPRTNCWILILFKGLALQHHHLHGWTIISIGWRYRPVVKHMQMDHFAPATVNLVCRWSLTCVDHNFLHLFLVQFDCVECNRTLVTSDDGIVRPSKETFDKYLTFFLSDLPSSFCAKAGRAAYSRVCLFDLSAASG